MKRLGSIIAVVLLVALLPGGATAHDGAHASDPSRCICETANASSAWCTVCAVGTVAGVRIASPVLYELLDPHGHEVDLTNVPCPVCHAAIETDAWCESCAIGFSEGRAYVSRLTWLLARGAWVDPARESCAFCRDQAGGDAESWCLGCERGLVGGYAFADRELFASARRARQRLLSALDLLPTCEYCAAASFTGGRCPKCNIQYGHERSAMENGESSPGSPPASEGTIHR